MEVSSIRLFDVVFMASLTIYLYSANLSETVARGNFFLVARNEAVGIGCGSGRVRARLTATNAGRLNALATLRIRLCFGLYFSTWKLLEDVQVDTKLK